MGDTLDPGTVSPSTSRRRSGAPLPVVDPHVRLVTAGPSRGPSADPLAPLRELLDRAGGCHLLRAVHVQPDLDRREALADIARVQTIARTRGSGGLPNGVVACCDASGDGAEARLDALAEHAILRGIRPPDGAALPTDLEPLARRALVLELPIDRATPEDVARLAASHPACPLVLDDGDASLADGGSPLDTTAADDIARRRHTLDALRHHENVLLKLGYREAGDSSRTTERLRTRIDHALRTLGHERVMLSVGVIARRGQRPRHERWRLLAVAAGGLAASHRNALFRTNAARVYRL